MKTIERIQREIEEEVKSIFFHIEFDSTIGKSGSFKAISNDYGVVTYGPTIEKAENSARQEIVALALYHGSLEAALKWMELMKSGNVALENKSHPSEYRQ